jgi:hypothetical protein
MAQTIAWVACLLLLGGPSVWAQGAKPLLEASFSQASLDLEDSTAVNLQVEVATGGSLTIQLLDLDGQGVKTLAQAQSVPAGTHTYTWDGRDDHGRPCYSGWYFPYLTFNSETDGYQLLDPSQTPWGQRLKTDPVQYDADAQTVVFELPQPAMGLIRIGEIADDLAGPVYGALSDWTAYAAGKQTLTWDGWDSRRVLKLADRKDLVLLLDTYSLPQPGIALANGRPLPHTPTQEYRRLPITPPQGKDGMVHARHMRCFSHELTVDTVALDQNGGVLKAGDTISGTCTFKVSITGGHDRRQLLNEGLEAYIFVDGKMIYERPYERFPLELPLDTQKLSNDEHIVVLVVRTLQDRLGSQTLRIHSHN